jgi:NAD(P)-dependent dehydrogenase (short-subunit alcohol dehydrogenase family)
VGYQVVATARRIETLSGLSVAMTAALDVTAAESIAVVVAAVLERFGRIDVLVNNAGCGVRGAVEEVPIALAQAVFDVNVYGPMRLIQAVAPSMRRHGGGRILNISSIAGRLVTPVNGVYAASKAALEALSDALRHELAPWGIQVIVVEPGSLKTAFHAALERRSTEVFSHPTSPYRPLYERSVEVTAALRRQEAEPDVVSRTVLSALTAQRPRARYLAGFPVPGPWVVGLRDWVWDPVVSRLFHLS